MRKVNQIRALFFFTLYRSGESGTATPSPLLPGHNTHPLRTEGTSGLADSLDPLRSTRHTQNPSMKKHTYIVPNIFPRKIAHPKSFILVQ